MEKKFTVDLTEVDRNILRLMQKDVSLSMAEIAQRAGLSQSACWRRIARFEQDGIIVGKVAMLNPDKLNLGVVVFANIRLSSHSSETLREFEQQISACPEVMECYSMTGTMDFLLRIVTSDIHSYEQFFRNHLSNIPAVQEVHSSVAITQVKYTTELPI